MRERDNFEAWHKANHRTDIGYARYANGKRVYVDDDIEFMWISYQAAVEHCKQGDYVAIYEQDTNHLQELQDDDMAKGWRWMRKDFARGDKLFAHAMPKSEGNPCKGTNCGTTTNDHSPECIAEHDACYKGADLDCAGNRHPEFRYKGYKSEPLPDNHTLDQFKAYTEGVKAQLRLTTPKPATPQPTTDISELQTENAQLMNALEISNKGLIVLQAVLSTANLPKGSAKAYEMFEDNNKLLTTIRHRQAHRESLT